MDYFLHLCLMFFFYSFVGWVMEVIYTFFLDGKIINRGFLIGPQCPIYGVGSLLITLLLAKYKSDIIVLFFMSMAVCSILEYTTSYLMEKIFKNRWWDYSNFKFNINGRICLETIIPFGICSLIIFYLGNPFVEKVHNFIPNNIEGYIIAFLFGVFIIDLVLSFNVIITLKNISATIKTDSTELITKKVKQIVFSKNFLFRRLLDSFPDMKIFNKMSLLKDKLNSDKRKLKEEKKKEKEERKREKLEKKLQRKQKKNSR